MEKPTRPVRNRRHSRRAWPPGDTHRPPKRLFTPEIKKMLKDWLVRRRENPYPSRDEKKTLAYETGLTYIQICNWFANWRRKLKNSGREPVKKTWGHLIKNYNTSAKGNVEQFSISSSDSIWGDDEHFSRISDSPSYSSNYDNTDEKDDLQMSNNNSEYLSKNKMYSHPGPGFYVEMDFLRNTQEDHRFPAGSSVQAQCYQVSSTTEDRHKLESKMSHYSKSEQLQAFSSNTKYKQQMMEKYLRDTSSSKSASSSSSPELSKWLKSAAKFTPNKNNYFIEWSNKQRHKSDKKRPKHVYDTIHQKEELDAAEALANLAFNCRQRMANSENFSVA